MSRKVVIIGGDAAGMTAATKVRRSQKDWNITVFEKSPHTSYSACGIPYYVAGQVPDVNDLIVRTPKEFKERHNIQAFVKHEVTKIDPVKKVVSVRDMTSGILFKEPYDDLLIATGASPITPNVPGWDIKGVFSLSTLQSGVAVWEYIREESPKSAVVVGGGYIGIEMAEALVYLGIKTVLVSRADQVMPTLDKDMAEAVAGYMEEKGVKTFLREELAELVPDESGRIGEVVTGRQRFHADLVILGIGVKPNTILAEDAGLKCGETGAILTNAHMCTSDPHIWAAGDCASSYHLIKKKEVFIALGTVANKQGLVAGSNIAGEKATFPGVLGTAITKFMDMEIARTGLSEMEAKSMGMDVISATISTSTKAGYYPGSGQMQVKLLARKDSGRLLGGQIVGMSGAAKRIDTIVSALMGKLTAHDLVFADLSYAPPFSSVWDPVQVAARRLL